MNTEPQLQRPRRNTGRIALVVIALVILGVIGWAVTRGGGNKAPKAVEEYSKGESSFVLRADEGFQAVFPLEPTRSVRQISGAGTEFDVVLYMAQVSRYTYSTLFADAGDIQVPPELGAREGIKRLVDETSGKLEYTRRGTMDGRPSFDFLIAHQDKFLRGVVIIDGGRGYTLAIDSPDEDPDGFGRFRRSFRIS